MYHHAQESFVFIDASSAQSKEYTPETSQGSLHWTWVIGTQALPKEPTQFPKNSLEPNSSIPRTQAKAKQVRKSETPLWLLTLLIRPSNK
jgi:hypothetical protein